MDDAVSEEVVVEGGQVGRATCQELDRGVDFERQGVARLDGAEDIFLLLVQLVALGREMLDDFGGTVEDGGGGNVVEGGIVGQAGGAWSSEELQVSSLQRHCDAYVGVEDVVDACEEMEVRKRGEENSGAAGKRKCGLKG